MFKFYCNGGPYEGATLLLESPTTVVFTAKGQTGRYRCGRAIYGKHPLAADRFEPVSPDVRYGHDLIWEKHNV